MASYRYYLSFSGIFLALILTIPLPINCMNQPIGNAITNLKTSLNTLKASLELLNKQLTLLKTALTRPKKINPQDTLKQNLEVLKSELNALSGLTKTKEKKINTCIETARSEKGEYLNLSGLRLAALPASLFTLTTLQDLDLSKNKLTIIPAEIESLDKLKTLNLSKNTVLSTIPVTVANLTKMTKLTVDENHLEKLPLSITSIKNLTICIEGKSLCLSSQELEQELRGEGKNYQDAQAKIKQESTAKTGTLSLQGKRLKKLPPELFALTHLKKLNLAINDLQELSPEFANLVNLIELNLTENKIREIEPGILDKLVNLQILYLDLNLLTDLPFPIGKYGVFHTLWINNNKLEPSMVETIQNQYGKRQNFELKIEDQQP